MDSCDVLIVGGGPAGSSCAWGLRSSGLRSSGLRVVVLDKARFPRNKVCGGWITPFVLQTLEIDPEDYKQSRTFQPITGFRISSLGKRKLKFPIRSQSAMASGAVSLMNTCSGAPGLACVKAPPSRESSVRMMDGSSMTRSKRGYWLARAAIFVQ